MRRLILGTAGHIDHGKTALVRALTGTDTDRLAEEKRRGITIDLGFASLRLGEGTAPLEFGVVDVPGHEGFIRNMLAGATGMDLVLLVVAADEGVMPQTREHLAIVELLGVRAGVVAVTKTDVVDAAWLELVVDDLRSELERTPFADAPVVPVSAVTGDGLDALREALREAAATVAVRSAEDLFRMPVDRVFTIRGTGTVVTGTVWSGRIARDQAAGILPSEGTARIRSVQVHGVETDTAGAGQRVALALAGIDRSTVARGAVLVTDDAWRPHHMITARLRLLPDTEWEIHPRQRVRFHLGTAEVLGRVALLDRERLGPGEVGWAQLRLEAPVVARAGDRFVIRSYSPVTTIGGGTIAEPAPPKRRRVSAAEADILERILAGSAAEGVLARTRAAGWQGAAIARLPIETPHAPAAVATAIASLDGNGLVRVGGRVFADAVGATARERLLAAIDAYHRENPLRPGMDREELRRALPAHADSGLVEWAISALLDESRLEVRGGPVARKDFRPVLTPGQERARDQLMTLFAEAGLTPPLLAELPAGLRDRPDFWPLLKLLEHDGALVPLAPELYIARTHLDAAISTVRRELAGRTALGPADFKNLFSISRKYLIPLLEYLDRAGITIRRGDERFLRPHQDQTGPAPGR